MAKMIKSVALAPGESKLVAFEFMPTTPKVYTVSVDSLSGSFTAIAPPTGIIINSLMLNGGTTAMKNKGEEIAAQISISNLRASPATPLVRLGFGSLISEAEWQNELANLLEWEAAYDAARPGQERLLVLKRMKEELGYGKSELSRAISELQRYPPYNGQRFENRKVFARAAFNPIAGTWSIDRTARQGWVYFYKCVEGYICLAGVPVRFLELSPGETKTVSLPGDKWWISQNADSGSYYAFVEALENVTFVVFEVDTGTQAAAYLVPNALTVSIWAV